MKKLLIMKAGMSGRYYATRSYKVINAYKGLYQVTGQKEDVTEQIEALIAEAQPVNTALPAGSEIEEYCEAQRKACLDLCRADTSEEDRRWWFAQRQVFEVLLHIFFGHPSPEQLNAAALTPAVTPDAQALAREICKAWGEYCDGMGGTPDGDDYLQTLIQSALSASAPRGMREALRKMIYETTCLSPMEEDGSHWCRISKATLEEARAAYHDTSDTALATHAMPHKFGLGQRVTKLKGSSWTGKVVGFYSTELTPVGYAVESENEPGSVQIYPEAALESSATTAGAGHE